MSVDARTAEPLFEAVFATSPAGMALVGLDDRILRANPALCRLLGFTEPQLRARTARDLRHPADEQARFAGDGEPVELRYVRADGSVVFVRASTSLVRDGAGRPLHFVLHVADVTERRRLAEQVRLLATHDPATGIWNRRRFEEELARQFARSLRHAEIAAVLAIRLDDLQPIVDDLGAEAGDQVASAVARILARRLRGTDSVARLETDQFAVLLCNTDAANGETVALELSALIAVTPIQAAGRAVTVRASVGVASVDDTCTSPADILARAAVARTLTLR